MSAVSRHSTAVMSIATPEGVTFSLPLAGPVTRALAYFIDVLTIMVISRLLQHFTQLLMLISPDLSQAMPILIDFVLMIGYATACELLFNGQTLGKRVLRIRVMDERGLRLQAGQIIIRNLMRVLDFLPFGYGLGGLFCLLGRRCQRLGDLAAGTIVVREVTTTAPKIDDVLGGKYNSFRSHPHLEARLRQKISAEEAQIALSAILRTEELTPEARVTVFTLLADRFKAAATFPDDAIFGLSDEQYVRNAVDSIYRKAK